MTPTAAGRCPSCRHAVGWKRGKAEGWLCFKGYVFAALAGGTQLPSRTELRRADLETWEACGEWEKR